MPRSTTYYHIPGNVTNRSALALLVEFLVRPNTKGVNDCRRDIWVPKSESRVVTENPFVIELPEWLLEKKEKELDGRMIEAREARR